MAAHPLLPRPLRLTGVALALALALGACTGGGPGSEEDLVTALTRDDTFTTPQAECIANAVFNEYGDDETALGRISAAADFESLSGEDGVEGFAAFYDRALDTCVNN